MPKDQLADQDQQDQVKDDQPSKPKEDLPPTTQITTTMYPQSHSLSRAQQKAKNKRAVFMDKALDLPYYKGIQLPEHLKWITVQSVSTISIRDTDLSCFLSFRELLKAS